MQSQTNVIQLKEQAQARIRAREQEIAEQETEALDQKQLLDERERQELEKYKLEYSCSDTGNARRYIAQHGSTVAYIPKKKNWAVFDGQKWTLDEHLASAKVDQTVQSILPEMDRCTNDDGKVKLAGWYARSLNKYTKQNILPMVKDSNVLNRDTSEFDTERDWINCSSGFVNLRTGERKDHSAEQMTMKMCHADVKYEPEKRYYKETAEWSFFSKFLSSVFVSEEKVADEKYISWMQKLLGYSITGQVNQEKFYIAFGRGGDGKSKLFGVVTKVLGDYREKIKIKYVLEGNQSGARVSAAIGNLDGARFVLGEEPQKNVRWNEAQLKVMTGGDELLGGAMYRDDHKFWPMFKMWLMVNELPRAIDATRGFWRRVVVLPFHAAFKEGKDLDDEMEQQLWECRDVVFAWLVEGAKRYYDEKLLDVPEIVEQAKVAYRHENDILQRFIDEELVRDQKAKMTGAEMYKAIKAWCGDVHPIPEERWLAKNMGEREVENAVVSRVRTYFGVKLHSEELIAASKREGYW